MKRLVVCCDGTWNVADPVDGSPTNIVKLAMNVAPVADGIEQRVYYHSGVGTGPVGRLAGGAFGFGLSDLVKDAYRFLVTTYEPGDDVFLFGFSRGAFTVRSLAGLVRNSGILRPEHVDRLEEAYRLYRSREDPDEPEGRAATLFRTTWAREAGIRCIGVFDTVGALGVPFTGNGLGAWINQRWAFHDTRLGPHVRSAFHALAIDERRSPFTPSLWTTAAPGQDVEQVWFRGCHSDIGGGLKDPDLADVTLRWMVARAKQCGLGFADDALAPACAETEIDPSGRARSREERCTEARARGAWVDPDPRGEVHDSARWWPPGTTDDRRFGERPGEAVAAVVRQHPTPPPGPFRDVADDRFVEIGELRVPDVVLAEGAVRT